MGFNPILGVWGRRNKVELFHSVVLGAAGVLASQDAQSVSGILCGARISAGRYLLTIPSKYRRFLGGTATIIGTTTAAMTAAKALAAFFRVNNIDAGTQLGNILLQFARTDTNADADVDDNLTFMIKLEVEA